LLKVLSIVSYIVYLIRFLYGYLLQEQERQEQQQQEQQQQQQQPHPLQQLPFFSYSQVL
jgi:hypothetical protein